MPPVRDALLKLRILTAPHVQLRHIAMHVLSLDRKRILHPHLGALLTLHSAFDLRLQTLQMRYGYSTAHLPDAVFDEFIKLLCHLPRVISDTTEGLSKIASVLSTPSFKGLPASFVARVRAFCLYMRVALRTMDDVGELLGKCLAVELPSDDEDEEIIRGLLDIVTEPGGERITVEVDGGNCENRPFNVLPFYSVYVACVGGDGKVAKFVAEKLEKRGCLTYLGEQKGERKKEIAVETADVGVFVIGKGDGGEPELVRFLDRIKEGGMEARPVRLVPVFWGVGKKEWETVKGGWRREVGKFDGIEVGEGAGVDQVVDAVIKAWDSLSKYGHTFLGKEPKPP